MSIKLGSTLLAGIATNTIENAHSLLDYKWTDHILNELSWLRADTFSWQSGSLYVGAYNHLVADIQGRPVDSETINGTTIYYWTAEDGHKIIGYDEYTDDRISAIYNSTGVAWYYIIDTVNTRFKLPRINPTCEELTSLIQSPVKGNGMTLGWTADGIGSYGTFTSDSRTYTRTGTVAGTILPAANGAGGSQITSTNGYVGITTDGSKSGLIADLSNATKTSVYKGKKYLYFYVGNFSQSATEQTAGLNSSLFNGKADIDLSNAASNASASAKETIVGWGMPDYSTEITTGLPTYPTSSTTQTYTCPVNGWILMCAERASSGYTLQFFVGNTIKMRFPANTASFADIMYPVSKGDVIKINTDSASTTWTIHWCNFISCKGA